MPLSLTQDRALRIRARSNRLLRSVEDPLLTAEDVLYPVCGLQAQELPAALLSARARSQGLTSKTIEQARLVNRTVVRTWLMRGTLHLATAGDAAWMVPFFGPIFISGDRRRMAGLGWDEARVASGMRLVLKALEAKETLTRPEIVQLLREESLPAEGQAPIHLIFRLAMEGLLCFGPDRGIEHTFTRFETWASPLRPLLQEEALAVLARRYLAAYAPSSPPDLASWSGLPIGKARQAFDSIREALASVEIAGNPAWMLVDQLPWIDEIDRQPPAIRLLPRYDTYLLGYANRGLAVPQNFEKRVHPGGGQIHASLLVDGRIVGTWKTIYRRGRLEISVKSFEALIPDALPLLEAEVEDVGRFLGVETVLSV